MDKASIIKDAIDYIQHLHDQERVIQAEITELESRKLESGVLEYDQEMVFMSTEKSKKKKIEQSFDASESSTYPVEILEVSAYFRLQTIFSRILHTYTYIGIVLFIWFDS